MTPTRRSAALVPALAAALLLTAACDVEWGGARVDLETPDRPATVDTARAEPEETDQPPLPEAPLLHVVRVDGDGRATALPAARMTPAGPAPLELPESPPEGWWERFDDSLRPPGAELPLHATGRRIGTLILGAAGEPVNAGCPAPAEGRVLLPPGAAVPGVAFAWAPTAGERPRPPEPAARPASGRRLRLFGPILAERLLEDAGVGQPFLARRAALEPVAFTGDTAPGMAATYLIGDTLAPVPPRSDPAHSLFFLARFDPSDGYVPVWSRTATYRDTAGKTILSHLDWIVAPEGRVDLLRRIDARGGRLAAVRTGGGEPPDEPGWIASGRCRVLETLGLAAP